MSKRSERVIVFAKNKPGLKSSLLLLEEHFDNVHICSGESGDAFPVDVYLSPWDLCISYLSPWIIPKQFLDRVKYWSINFHPGPPQYPGIGCTNFAIYDGALEYGVTAHHMESKVDTGKIISVLHFPIEKMETVYSLTEKSYRHIEQLFAKILLFFIHNGSLPKTTEHWRRKPFTRKELNALCRITPEMTEAEMYRRIHAAKYPGMPGAYIDLNGTRIYDDLVEKFSKLSFTMKGNDQ